MLCYSNLDLTTCIHVNKLAEGSMKRRTTQCLSTQPSLGNLLSVLVSSCPEPPMKPTFTPQTRRAPILNELGIHQEPVPIYEDNQAVIFKLTRNETIFQRIQNICEYATIFFASKYLRVLFVNGAATGRSL